MNLRTRLGLWSQVKRWWRSDLIARLYVSIFLAVALSTGLYTAYEVEALKAEAETRLQEQAERLLTTVAEALSRPLFDLNTLAVSSVVDAMASTPNLDALLIHSPDGQLVAGSGSPREATDRWPLMTLQRDISFSLEGRAYPVGRVTVSLSKEEALKALRLRIWQVFGANALLAMVIWVSIFMLGRKIAQPFADVQLALEHLAQGQTEIRLSGLEREDQIGRLSKAVQRFRDVLTELRRSEQAILELNAKLEDRIAERTLALSQSVTQAQDSEETLQAVVDTAMDAVVRTSASGLIMSWNHQAESLWGWSAHEVLGRSILDVAAAPSCQEVLKQQFHELLVSSQPTMVRSRAGRTEVLARHRNGRDFPVEWSVTRVLVHRGTAYELCSFVRDISELKQAEEETRAALSRQQELLDLRSRFVAMTSHEFRTPLTTILSSVELLRHYGARLSSEDKEELFGTIDQGVQRMTRMLDRVLLIGRADAEMLEFHPQHVELQPLYKLLQKEAQAQHADARATIHTQITPPHASAWVDENLIRHILVNLLSNALKYSPDGGVVRFTSSLSDDCLRIEVQDQGIGIPAADLPQLFDSFHRAQNVGNIPGTGLGLSITRKAVELHGGHIHVESVVGQGTRFVVELPQNRQMQS